jgi:hypothetical protein
MTTYLIAVPYLTVLLVLVFYGPSCPTSPCSCRSTTSPTCSSACSTASRRWTTPASKLEIQVLDDSTDETPPHRAPEGRGARRARHRRGVHPPHRPHGLQGRRARQRASHSRQGRAGRRLRRGLRPQRSFLAPRAPLHGPKVGMVQARWGHLNREATRCSRACSPSCSTATTWSSKPRATARAASSTSRHRRHLAQEAIVDAGGWQHDTLTEDLDLSYRAQLKGWRFVYRPTRVTPAELPAR